MNTSPLLDRIARELDKRRSFGLFRSVAQPAHQPHDTIDCSTNSYLGLHADPDVAREAATLAGVTYHGNLASRLISENTSLYTSLEREIADWEKTESALVFTSGYAANLGILQALCTRSTEVFTDRLNHASLYDGIKLSGCKTSRYRHADMADLKRLMQSSTAPEKVIVTDSVFSMDGDIAPLADIADLARSNRATVMVDEAHATGMFGKHGSGLVEATGTAEVIDIRMGTLSKAVAGLGGYVAVSKLLRDYFVNFSRSFIYSTGLPCSALAHNLAAIRHIRSHPGIGARVIESANTLRKALNCLGYPTGAGTTQIVPCIVESDRMAVDLSRFLATRNILVPAIRPPTVPAKTARLRFSWSALCTDFHRESIIAALTDWKKSHG